MAVVSDYNPGDLLTGTAGEGGDGENAVKDLSISDALVKTLASFADLQETELNPGTRHSSTTPGNSSSSRSTSP